MEMSGNNVIRVATTVAMFAAKFQSKLCIIDITIPFLSHVIVNMEIHNIPPKRCATLTWTPYVSTRRSGIISIMIRRALLVNTFISVQQKNDTTV
jgi:hypothetical protein